MNVGQFDRFLRFLLAAGLIGYGLYQAAVPEIPAAPQVVWGFVAVGAVFFATAALSFCPLYRLVGLRTRSS